VGRAKRSQTVGVVGPKSHGAPSGPRSSSWNAMRFLRLWPTLLVMSVVGVMLFAAPAAAVGEIRKEGSCSGTSEWSLRLRAEDGEIRVEFEIEMRRTSAAWRVIVLHDRRTAFSRTLSLRGSERLRVRRVLVDWYGRDTITVRASGPLSETCRVSATV
jgi:hypothetical protein